MNATLSVQDLWSQILALPAGDRHWLASKLYDYEEVYEEEEERLTPYTMEEINAWIDESEADFAAGRYISNEEMNRRMEQFREVCYK